MTDTGRREPRTPRSAANRLTAPAKKLASENRCSPPPMD